MQLRAVEVELFRNAVKLEPKSLPATTDYNYFYSPLFGCWSQSYKVNLLQKRQKMNSNLVDVLKSNELNIFNQSLTPFVIWVTFYLFEMKFIL